METATQVKAINEENLNALLGKFVGDLGATMSAGTIVIGHELGLYKAMKAAGSAVTSGELAASTSTDERYVREWLNAQAASGYVEYDADAGRYFMTPEQEFVMTDETSAAYLPGAFVLASSTLRSTANIVDRFRTGEGMGWHEHDEGVFCGTELFFRPGYGAHLVSDWIPSLDGIEQKLVDGGRVADVGCGHGASTILMAQAYPKSSFHGFDYHEGSIEVARQKAEEAGVADRVTFSVVNSKEFPGQEYDLVCTFDCLHDMGDPAGASKHIKESLAEGGSWLIVEPYAGDTPESNHNPVGRIYYSASTMLCTPASLSQEVGTALGAQAGEKRLREVVTDGGFDTLRRATETPFNIVLEAK
jgi:2-polyprenyl-3-methyl-5-hydroxy-6-metoxy-1,4-benzoquinol methylase